MKRRAAIWILTAHVACSFSPEEEGLPETAVTQWTNKTELFMEYEALVAGRETRFAVHLTDLRSFEPIGTGTATLELENESGKVERFEGPTAARPGIFRVVANVTEAGRYRMLLRVAEPRDTHDLGEVMVYATEDEAVEAYQEEPESEPTVAFLKEQQWVTDFRTEVVHNRSLHRSVRVPAEVRPRAGGEAKILSPVGGRLVVEGKPPVPGSRVRRGQRLARIAPRASQPEDRALLELALATSEADLEQASRNRERVERLLEAKAIPARRLEEARRDEAVAAARRESARKRLSQFEETLRTGGGGTAESFVDLVAPLSGILMTSDVTPGAAVEEGEELFRVVDPDVVFVVGAIPEVDAASMKETSGVELYVPGRSETLVLNGERGFRVSLSAAVDPATRTVPIVFQVNNEDRVLLVGQTVRLVLITEETQSTLSVPVTALVEEGNQSVAYVQVDGESFARRPLEIGLRDRDYVEVLGGLRAGERVVTRGAYEVRLASLSGQIPAEGHVH